MNQVGRLYKMSDSRLIQLAECLKISAIRDLCDLEKHGVSTSTLNELQSAIFNFKGKATDEELSSNIVLTIQTNNSEKELVKQQIRQISERARVKHVESDALSKQHQVDLVNKQCTVESFPNERRMQNVPFEQLSELSTKGISQYMLESLGCFNKNSVNSINFQSNAIKIRDIAVEDRIHAGNSLFAMMISLATKGKKCWVDVSEKRFNDYNVAENYINNWQCTDGNIGPYIVVNISVTSISDATIFTLSNMSSVPLNFFFAENPTDSSGVNQVTVAPGNSQSYTSISLGYNEASSKTRLNVLNANALPGSYMVEWI